MAASFNTFAQVNLTSGLVAHYPFDGDANDQVGNNHGTIFGPTFIQDRDGLANRALFFDGNDYVTVPSNANINFGFNDFSISFWVRTSYTQKQMILQKGGDFGPAVPQYWIRDNDNTPNLLRHLTGDGNPPSPNVAESSLGIHDGNWHHIATARQGALLRMYFDGCLVATDNTDPRNINNNVQLIIGAQNAWGSHGIENFFHGSLDDLRFYDRVLNEEEILTLAENKSLTSIDAGDDHDTCQEEAILDAEVPTVGSGIWNVIAGSAIIDNINDPKSMVRQLTVGANVFEWTLSNGCETMKDTITIQKLPGLEIPDAGNDQILCNTTQTYLEAQGVNQVIGNWATIVGSAQFTDINDPNTLVFGLSKGDNLFEWTVSNSCTSESDQVLITVLDTEITSGLSDGLICRGETIILEPGLPGATYRWSNGSTTPSIVVDKAGTYWVDILANGCTTRDSVVIDYWDQNHCAPQSLVFHNAINPKSDIPENRSFYLHNPSSTRSLEISIFNRWGELIFHSTDKNFKWSGDYRGKLSPTGVYAYKVKYSPVTEDRLQTLHGIIYLIY